MSNTTTGGVWTSGNNEIATAGSPSGIVSGVSPGTVLISYAVTGSNGCIKFVTKTVTVNALPSVPEIGAGSGEVCVGSVLALSESTTGGTHTWISANTATATVNASTGAVAGAAAGEVVISYRYTNVCTNYAMTTISVNVVTTPTITGTAGLCAEGNTTTLTGAPGGGTWISSSTRAVIGSSGDVTSTSAGTANITYMYLNENGCAGKANIVVTVLPLPSVAGISGAGSVCVGSAITLTDTSTGGVWTSGNSGIATVGSTSGIVSGVSQGTVLISYAVTGEQWLRESRD